VAKYHDIVGGSWEQRSLFAESVPHLFHYDMTYLWVLEQQRDQRPKTWLGRVEAWKLLFRMFLLEQVSIVTEELRTPLIEVTERFGISNVTWLKSRQSGQPIGVLSPTVIVRPLPDFTETDLDRWRVDFKDHELDFNHLAFVAVKDLLQLSGSSPYAPRIADILRKEFNPAQATTRPPAGRPIAVPILNRLTWERREGDATPLAQVNLLVRSTSERPIAEYIPYCASCGSLLLQERDAAALDVNNDELSVLCQNKDCKNPDQKIPLELLGIWLRNASSAVLWLPDMIPPMPDLKLPPLPAVTANQFAFEWNKASVGGEPFRRFLKLSVGERRIESRPLMSIFFERLLVPGRLADFHGRAVVPDWGDAIDPEKPGDVRVSPEMNQVEFRGLKIRGWPVTFTKFYKDTSLSLMPVVAVGLFPDPSIVGSGWKWYRAFVHGTGVEDLEVSGTGMTPLLPNLVTTESGLPAVVGIRSLKQKSTGVSYIPSIRAPIADYGGTAQASLAVDFGTTNTVVYHQPPGSPLVARAKTHGLNPRDFAKKVLWLADSGVWQKEEVLGGFLPGPAFRPDAVDSYLIPSEAWRLGRQGLHLIRWMGDHPEKSPYPPAVQFKWDEERTDYYPTRRAYLKEVLLQALPLAISAFDPARVTEVNIGFSYPLAFEHEARGQFRKLLQATAEDLSELTGLSVSTTYSINESAACVNAFGAFNGDTFLVADMGGGTLDVALFSVQPSTRIDQHQMGSLRFAGERCVNAMAEQVAPKATLEDLRDAIARGDSHKKYAKQDAEMLSTRFATIAFEFLRTMIAAYRTLPGKETEEIKVVLVGNGWHLVEAFSRETRARGAKNVYLEIYADLVRSIGDPNLTFYAERPLTEFPSSKHLVVAGALQNVTGEAPRHEVAEQSNPLAKLPAGRKITIAETIDVPWSDLVGEGLRLPQELDLATATTANMVVTMDEGAPAATGWMRRFATSVQVTNGKIPYPTAPELLREMRASISGSPPKLKRGPLQLILELEWARTLTDEQGRTKA
jgi:hypothetical protein